MVTRPAEGQGYDTLLLRARPKVVAVTLAKHGGLTLLLFGPPMVWAIFEAGWSLATALAVAAFVGVVPMALVWRQPLSKDLRQVEAMVSFALVFLLAALLSIPAFLVLDMPLAAAAFEGMSAITTTGLSVAADPDAWPFAGHVLRAWMQWCGGLAMATAVLALVLGPGPASRRLGQAGIDQGDRIASTRKQARQLLAAYVGLSLAGAAILAMTAPRWSEGIVLALAAVSTGGFAPRSDSLAGYTTLTQTLVIFFSVLGAMSLLTLALLSKGDAKGAWALGSVQRVTRACVGVSVLYAVWLWGTGADAIWPKVLDLLSGLSTAGFSTGAMPVAGPVLVLFLVVMIMGGDEGSTAGGLKLARIGLIARGARHALALPRLPDKTVAPLRMEGRPVTDRRLIALLALVSLYATTAVIVWTWMLAHGYAAGPALFDTVSALSTVGLSAGVVGADMPVDLMVLLTLAMWLGRLEFIAVLVLILPRTWHHPKKD
ncbi:TrkH family potassium uptake protein [Marivita sp. S6314]|uniref:TrkH family potassium uptake protein n=1 Tax=Marivita sp. S6314 TaxID=2926406 RepID=UPI001FF39858|nr:potassium transporter TrkG [Marivita sp. S6314]MCK0149497.1 TrkH family potassium uptake protein [Marivita sp. S6314]